MTRLATLSLTCLLALALAACSSNPTETDPPPRLTVAGTWSGQVTSLGVVYQVDLTITQNGGQLGGSGTIQSPQDTLSYDIIAGFYAHPFLGLPIRFDRPPMGQVSGNVSEERDLIRGTMDGPGFAGPAELMLVRQPAVIAAP